MSIFGPCIKSKGLPGLKPKEPREEFGMTTVTWEAPRGAERKKVVELPLIHLRPTPTTTIMGAGGLKRINNDFGQFYLSWHAMTKVRLVQTSSHTVGLFGGKLSAGQAVKATSGVVLFKCILEAGECTPIKQVTLHAKSRAQVTVRIEIGKHLRIKLSGQDTANCKANVDVAEQELDLETIDLTKTTLLWLKYY